MDGHLACAFVLDNRLVRLGKLGIQKHLSTEIHSNCFMKRKNKKWNAARLEDNDKGMKVKRKSRN